MWRDESYFYYPLGRNESVKVVCTSKGSLESPPALNPVGCVREYRETHERKCEKCEPQFTIHAARFTDGTTHCTQCKPDKDTICARLYPKDSNPQPEDCGEWHERHTLTIKANTCEDKKIVTCAEAYVNVKQYKDNNCEGEIVQEYTLDALKCHPAHFGSPNEPPCVKYECENMAEYKTKKCNVVRNVSSLSTDSAWYVSASNKVGALAVAAAIALAL